MLVQSTESVAVTEPIPKNLRENLFWLVVEPTNPSEKICQQVKLDHFPNIRDEHKKIFENTTDSSEFPKHHAKDQRPQTIHFTKKAESRRRFSGFVIESF